MDDASEDIKKSKRGRPRSDTSPVMVRMTAAELAAIDSYRRNETDLPSRPEAIRRILAQGLSSEPKVKPAPDFLAEARARMRKALIIDENGRYPGDPGDAE